MTDGDKINNNNADDKYKSNGLQPYFIPNPINSSDKGEYTEFEEVQFWMNCVVNSSVLSELCS